MVVLPQYESAKHLFLADLVTKHLVKEGAPPPSKNHAEQLYTLIAEGGLVDTETPQLESKLSECVFIEEPKKRAHWLNTQDGKRALGPVLNAHNMRKVTPEAVAREAESLQQLRVALLALFAEYTAELELERGDKKRKADDSESEAEVEKKKQRTETGSKRAPRKPEKAKPAEPTVVEPLARTPKSTKVPSSPVPSKKPPVPSAPQKPKRVESQVKPTSVTTITTVQCATLTPELRDHIMTLGAGEIRSMLGKSAQLTSATSSELHEVEWYKKYL